MPAGGSRSQRISRTPPADVRRTLAREVGFGCPVEGCASPYLEWHHFDPEWRIRRHHEPSGMIALCREHHAKAGAGAFTVCQLRTLKTVGAKNTQAVVGRFDWLRRDLLLVSGGVTYHETLNVLVLQDKPAIWFTREPDGLLRLNLNVSGRRQPRLQMRDNFWFNLADAHAVTSPTGGRTLDVRYPDGDRVCLEFREVSDRADWDKRYPSAGYPDEVLFPITSVTLALRIKRLDIDFKSGGGEGRIGGVTVRGSVISHCGSGILLD